MIAPLPMNLAVFDRLMTAWIVWRKQSLIVGRMITTIRVYGPITLVIGLICTFVLHHEASNMIFVALVGDKRMFILVLSFLMQVWVGTILPACLCYEGWFLAVVSERSSFSDTMFLNSWLMLSMFLGRESRSFEFFDRRFVPYRYKLHLSW